MGKSASLGNPFIDIKARTRRTDPETSRLAGLQATSARTTLRVFLLLWKSGEMTDADLVLRFSQFRWPEAPSSVRRCRKLLVEIGLVESSGERRLTKYRRWSSVWRLSSVGLAFVDRLEVREEDVA